MSELIVTPGSGQPSGSGLQPDYGLQVISEQPVLLRRSPTTVEGTVASFGSVANDFIGATDPNDPTIFNISGGDGNDTLVGAAGPDVILGELGDDFILGGESNDILDGGAGNDFLDGGGGNDYLQGGDGDDTLIGGEGVDLLDGGAGNDVLDGGGGDDVLLGGAGNDLLIGGIGNDSLQGGTGRDTLIGGEGKDIFRFERGSTGGRKRRDADVISDFTPGEDLIQLDRRLFSGTLRPGRLKPKDFKAVRKFSNDVDAAIVYERSTGLLYFKPDNGSTTILLQLDKNLKITAADFEVFY